MNVNTRMNNIRKILVIVFIVLALAVGTRRTAATQQDFFSQKVAPIFQKQCLMCHGERVQRSGLDLRTETSILKGGTRGPAVIPGKPGQSLLYRLIAHQEEPAMPLGIDKLSDEQISIIYAWIEKMDSGQAGAITEPVIPVRQPGYSITDNDRQFWAFVKPARPVIPSVRNQNRVRNEIDAFVLKRLEDNGLEPSQPAEPGVLLRRVYLDLIGLPPSPEEVAEFLKDPSDKAYQKVIDRLLASQHYGERWGRHWLDLARYADSGGYEFDVDRPHAWRYRDYVIKSINQDKPYDQFIREQLANDQLIPDDPEALIATAFCRNGPTVDNADNEETRTDELDDMVATTSSVFLGITVGCARCHDHKYDPIPQRDYYRMQAVFFPFQKTEKVMAPQSEIDSFKARQKEIDALLKPIRARISVIEKPIRDKLLAEKVEFHMRLAQSTGSLEGRNVEDYRRETTARFAKDVNLQPEEIDAGLTSDELKARKLIQNEIDAINKTRPKLLPAAMGITDKKDPGVAYLLKRGDWRQKGEEVQPGFPTVLAGGNSIEPVNRRKQLAEWIASSDNPLTARVAVNRIWQYHFGKGIVRTPSDFGSTGDRPSHPELLDWMALEFIKRGWSWKSIHRLILLSNTYRQSSSFNKDAAGKDPENRLFWRMNQRRMEAEIIRDSILSVSGKLNTEMFGPGIYPRIDPDVINSGSRPRWPLDAKDEPSVWRRSVYIFVKRSVLVPLIEVFDCPATTVPAPMRSTSTVSPQALALLNNDFVLGQAGFFAERVIRDSGNDQKGLIARAFNLALNRSPSAKESDWALEFIKTQKAGYLKRNDKQPDFSALRDFCHALLNLNEFIYSD